MNCFNSSPEYPKEVPTSIKALISFADMFTQNVIIRYVLMPPLPWLLPHRQSQLSDLTIRLHITTSLKSIVQKRWFYHHGRFDRFNCIINISTKVMWPIVLCPHMAKKSIFKVAAAAILNLKKINFWSRDSNRVQYMMKCTKFHQNRTIFEWNRTIGRWVMAKTIFKMATVRHLGF